MEKAVGAAPQEGKDEDDGRQGEHRRRTDQEKQHRQQNHPVQMKEDKLLHAVQQAHSATNNNTISSRISAYLPTYSMRTKECKDQRRFPRSEVVDGIHSDTGDDREVTAARIDEFAGGLRPLDDENSPLGDDEDQQEEVSQNIPPRRLFLFFFHSQKRSGDHLLWQI